MSCNDIVVTSSVVLLDELTPEKEASNANAPAAKRRRVETAPPPPPPLCKVISGGQSGADRAALEAALSVGLKTGGWIPRGFATSEGPRPELGSRFGLRELSQTSVAAAYVERSKRNVDDSDATLAFRLAPSRGTDRTIGYAQTGQWRDGTIPRRIAAEASLPRSHRPCLVVSALEPREQVVAAVFDFVQRHRVGVLNVAGHRESSAPMRGFGAAVEALLRVALAKLLAPACSKLSH